MEKATVDVHLQVAVAIVVFLQHGKFLARPTVNRRMIKIWLFLRDGHVGQGGQHGQRVFVGHLDGTLGETTSVARTAYGPVATRRSRQAD
jgi:hypothetical protein